jgi:hypothetical protein
MLASAGATVDGRPFPYLTREARIPRPGGAKAHTNVVRQTALAAGVNASPAEDLKYRGGWTIRDLKYMNIYVGGKSAWSPDDVANIDQNLNAAMNDRRLNNVIMQYFNNSQVSSKFLGSSYWNDWKPTRVEKADLANQVQQLYRSGALTGQDFRNTVFNFMLPPGTILGDPSAGQQKVTNLNAAIPKADEEDSTGGLGGYHGSVHIGNDTVYYAVGVYSQRTNTGTNGIPVFPDNWKNVVATFYHELQEARTDADVDDAQTGGMAVLGWTSDSGNEIGDYPIAEAKQLMQVFNQIQLADGSGTAPVQLCYSNAVHGPEGPIEYPHGMEPPPGTQPSSPPSSSNPNPAPATSGIPSNLPPDLMKVISNWDQFPDYIKQAIRKLTS